MVVTAVNYVVGGICGFSGCGDSIDSIITYYKGICFSFPAEPFIKVFADTFCGKKLFPLSSLDALSFRASTQTGMGISI